MTREEWMAEGGRRFGPDQMAWKFVCPSCGHVAATADWKAAGASSNAVAFSCVGRWLPNANEMCSKAGGPCNYAGGGLIRLNPVKIEGGADAGYFDFADVAESA